MADPLYELKNVTTKTFFTDLSARKDEYLSVLEEIYDESFTDKQKKTTKYYRVLNQNFSDYPSEIIVPFSGNFIVECYDIRERLALDDIQEEVLKVLDEKKVQVYVKYIISNLNQIIKKAQSLDLTTELQAYQSIIANKLQDCIEHLKATYLKLEQVEIRSTPKIKWIGNKNQLATLFYDLWKGQPKTDSVIGKRRLRNLIDATTSKETLMAFIEDNFVDSDNKPFMRATLSGVFSKSKSKLDDKAAERIDLNYN